MQLGGSETNERRVPSTLQEAYELRDASAIFEERDYYQERVYLLRGEESVRRRERSRAEALRAGAKALASYCGNGYSGGESEKRGLQASFCGTGVLGGGGKILPPRFYGYGG